MEANKISRLGIIALQSCGSTMSTSVGDDEWEAFQALETGSPLREWLGDAVYYSGRPRSRAMLIACEAGKLIKYRQGDP